MRSKLTKIAYFLSFSLLVLSLIRLSLWLIFADDFASLNTQEVLLSFWTGLRIDLITITTFSSLFILLLLLPFKFTDHHTYQKIIGYLWYLVLIIILFVLLADMVYFQFVHRHIGNEVTAMSNDTHVIVDMLLEYKLLVLFYALVSFGLFQIFKKIIHRENVDKESSVLKRIVVLLSVIVVVFLSIRGKVQGKSFSMADAFVVNKTASGNLALNGFFTLYRTISKKQKIYSFYPECEALKTVNEVLASEKFTFTDKAYPLLREHKNQTNKEAKPNVVILFLESWSAKYVDSFGKNNLQVTPYFDKLASEGLVFPNFYANGQRSIEGITAIFTGIPALKGFNYLGSGLELSNLSYLGNLAKENGYSTISMQSSQRGSFRIDAISKIAGFDAYYGAEDMPLVGNEDKDATPKFGTWDGNMYHLLSQKLSTQKEPFLSFSFTSTTHSPFVSPGKKWEQYEHDTTNIFGYLNTLKYADDKLGLFMENAKKEPWFDNTIFIMMADHTIGFGDDSKLFKDTNIHIKNRVLEEMRIPLLIYAPKIFEHQVIETIGSQADILPTLIDILDWEGGFATLSHSLFSPKDEQFVLFNTGETIGMINESGYVKHTLEKRLELSGEEALEKKLLSLYQVSSKLLRENKLIPTKSINAAH
ncbi:MAG TPA: LTA synthase family protein [Campylobacterales bacterium]|nr:LTA synthase family protein [Campylobacterales bacterium]